MPKPRHIQFHCKTSMSGSAEACDLRLAKLRSIADGAQETSWRTASEASKEEPVVPSGEVAGARLLSKKEMLTGEIMKRSLQDAETVEENAPTGFVCSNTLFEENERASS